MRYNEARLSNMNYSVFIIDKSNLIKNNVKVMHLINVSLVISTKSSGVQSN